MKKLIMAALLLASITTNAQSRKDSTISDSIPIISLADLKTALDYLSTKSTHANYLLAQEAYQLVLNIANAKLNATKPKSPKK